MAAGPGGHAAADLGSPEDVTDAHTAFDEAELASFARIIVKGRRRLGDYLDGTLFSNPGIDIVLFLFAEGLNGETVTTNACCAAAGVPRTTALRWIKLLQDHGVVIGSTDSNDRRVTMLALSPDGRATIQKWLSEIITLPERRSPAPAR